MTYQYTPYGQLLYLHAPDCKVQPKHNLDCLSKAWLHARAIRPGNNSGLSPIVDVEGMNAIHLSLDISWKSLGQIVDCYSAASISYRVAFGPCWLPAAFNGYIVRCSCVGQQTTQIGARETKLKQDTLTPWLASRHTAVTQTLDLV